MVPDLRWTWTGLQSLAWGGLIQLGVDHRLIE